MDFMNIQLTFDSFSFTSILKLILLGIMLAYMVWSKDRAKPTRYLMIFFVFLVLHNIAIFLNHTVDPWGVVLHPFLDLLLILSGIALLLFALHFPQYDQPRSSWWFVSIGSAIFLFVLIYSLWYAFQYIDGRDSGNYVPDTFGLVVIFGMSMLSVIFFGRATHYFPPPPSPGLMTKVHHFVVLLIFPPNRASRVLRDFGLIVLFALTPQLFNPSWPITRPFYENIVSLLVTFSYVLVYVIYTSERSTFVVKLVGVSLLTVLTILALLGLRSIETLQQRIVAGQVAEATLVRNALIAEEMTVFPEDVAYILAWPQTADQALDPSAYGLPYQRLDWHQLDLASLIRENRAHGVEDLFARTGETPTTWQNAVRYRLSTNTVAVARYFFDVQGRIYEVGFDQEEAQQRINDEITALIWISIFSALFLILLFPRFFHITLVKPLRSLLSGVQWANKGDLLVNIPVQYEDEIGFLTHSFNELVSSLQESNQAQDELNEALYSLNQTLEQRITERTAELTQAKTQAEAANRAKTDFLAAMSHELRTPLNAVLGFTQILQRTDPEQQELDIIRHSAEHLLTLINDLLDLAKVEASQNELDLKVIFLPGFLQNLADMMAQQAQKKGLAFHYQTSDSLPAYTLVDPKPLRQVLINLLGNGVKYTEEGRITFCVESHPVSAAGAPQSTSPDQHLLRFEVRDSGPGIASEDLPLIFEPFVQTESSAQRGEGLGLGLAISRQLVGLMGGQLQVESRLGEGSRFYFEIIVQVKEELAATEELHTPQIIGLRGKSPKILVVDDQPANRLVLTNMLEPLGFEIIQARDGVAGLEQARQQLPDAVITDLVMPELNGTELIQRLRETFDMAEMPVIVVSASAFHADREGSLAAGANAFLPKPIQMAQLLGLLQEILDIEWIYREWIHREKNDRQAGLAIPALLSPVEIKLPTPQQIAELQRYAQVGDIHALERRLAQLLREDADLNPFAQVLQPLLETFQMQTIRIWLMDIALQAQR